jgi:hypothetical protein
MCYQLSVGLQLLTRPTSTSLKFPAFFIVQSNHVTEFYYLMRFLCYIYQCSLIGFEQSIAIREEDIMKIHELSRKA